MKSEPGGFYLYAAIRLLVASPTAVLIFVVPMASIFIPVAVLTFAPIRLLRSASLMLPLFLFVSPRSLLLTLLNPWLLPMLLDCRSTLLMLR